VPVAWIVTSDALEAGVDDGRGPSTNWRPAIATRQVAAPAPTFDLWTAGGYEAVLTAAAAAGVTALDWQLSWARLAPTPDAWDLDAVDRYGTALAHAASLGLTVRLSAIDSTWPSWLGPEALLLPWTRPVLCDYGDRLLSSFGAYVSGVRLVGAPEKLILGGYRLGLSPPFRRRAGADERTLRTALADLDSVFADRVGDRALAALATVDVTGPVPDDMTPARRVSALVRGHGPYAAAGGLLRLDGQQCSVDPSLERWLA
jgi:hypothetical protein